MEEIPPEVQKGVRAALGERFRHGLVKTVQVETKGEKTDNKILALKNCRAFILSSKNPPKLEHEFNYLELEQIESTKPKQIKLKLLDRKDAFLVTAGSLDEASRIIEFIAESLKRVFPYTPLELFFDVKLEPSDRLDSLQNHLDCFSLPDAGPCGGFSQMYQFMCDFHGQPFMEEVAWDIDTIYLSQDSTELCLNDFDHLEAKDLVPILSSLMYNTWFKKVTVKDIRLCRGKGNRSNTINLPQGVEAMKEVINIVKRSTSLEQVVFNNTGFKSDFCKELATALQGNSNSALVLIDLSNNNLDDRGLKFLCPALANLQNGLVELSLPNTGITAEGVSALGKALSENNFFPTSLMRLNLSGNILKDGNIELLLNFLAQPNHLTHLDLSECGIALDSIFSALFRGCINLTHINVSGNVYSHKKGKDINVPKAVKQFFATTTNLQSLNIANCKLYPDAIKEIMLGIGSNRSLENVEVNLHSNELRQEGAKVIASCIANVPNITSLNLGNNDFCADMGSLMAWISQNKVLTHLDISENFDNVRQRNLQSILDSIVDVIQTETSPIRSLSIAKNKLKFETIPIINALGSNTTLTSIDISGNQMGDIGARMLAKALQINCKLEKIMLDNNCISPKGFQDIADALERNYSLKSIPPPMADLTACSKSGSSSEKAEAAFQRIQSFLQRNHSPQKFADAQAFRLQQGFLYTTSHQLVDKLVVQIQDACKELAECYEGDVQENIDKATGFIKDADNSKQLLEVLHAESRKSESDDVTSKLKEMATQIHNSVEDNLKKTAEGMIDGTKEKCPHIMENHELEESVQAVCKNRSTVPEKFVLSLIEQLNAQLSNQMSEANLAMAAHISDTIIDEIIDKLMNCHQSLGKHLSTNRNRTLSLSLLEINGPTSQDDVDHAEQGLGTKASPDSQQYEKKEGQSTATSKGNLRDKRKSVKLRPKSIMVQAQDVRQPQPAPREDQTPKVATPSTSAAPTPTKREPKKQAGRAAPNVSLGDFDAISSSSERPLRDARLDRPRRVRNVRPTRAVAIPQKDHNPGKDSQEDGGIQDVSEGVNDFFRPVDPELVATPVTQKTKSDTPAKEKKKEKEKKKGKDEKKKEKKKGLFGLFGKRRSSQPMEEAKESPSDRQGSEPVKNVTKEKVKPSPQQERKMSEVPEEDSTPPTPEYRSSEDELSAKDDSDTKSEDAAEKKEDAVAPVKVALKPMGGKVPLTPNIMADLKAKQAKRKSKEVVEPPAVAVNGEAADTPKKNDKPPPPVKPASQKVEETVKAAPEEVKQPEPVEEPPKKVEKEEEEEQVDEEEEKEEEVSSPDDDAVAEKPPSPKKTPPGGLLVLPPSPTKSNGSARGSIKSETSEGDKEESETSVLKSEKVKQAEPSPTLHETLEKPSSPAAAAAAAASAEEEEKPRAEDIPFPEVFTPKQENLPAEQTSSLQSSDNSLIQEAGASSPVKSSPPTPALSSTDTTSPIEREPSVKPSSPRKTSVPSPIQQKPSVKQPSPTKPSSPKKLPSPVPSLESEKSPSSPTKSMNPLFIPKKSNSVQERTSKEPSTSPKKSASIGARPTNQTAVEESPKVEVKVESKAAAPALATDNDKVNVNGDVKHAPKEIGNDDKKAREEPESGTNGEQKQEEDATKTDDKKDENGDQVPKRNSSIIDRMKSFETKENQETGMSIAEKRKSFEKKDRPPTASPRPLSITPGPKPAPRPKPQVAKRPVSSDKTASPVQSPPGSITKKAPPVAGRRVPPK
ncbi:uncharacterized protein [Apostichopus japonicus]|uniref:uncharacterized protein isoform X4 n=1 Tax=Stichopus japonicus TaxID=307972 RepID=UPI003AB4E165